MNNLCNILITGHKGLIGSELKKRLEQEGNKIIKTIDLREGKNILNINKEYYSENIDLMIHTAAHCKINESISNPLKTYLTNIKGTFEIFEFCRKNKIPKIVFFSSSRTLSKEKNPYTASKQYGEELCKAYYDSYGIEYLIIRPSTVYGPFWDETRRLMHVFIVNALENKDLEIYGDPKTKTLDFTYVKDFIEGVLLTLENCWNKEYNISGEQEFKVYDLAKEIIKKTNSKSKIIIKQAETAQPQQINVNISDIKKIGYKPHISLSQGVDNCIDFYREYLSKKNNFILQTF